MAALGIVYVFDEARQRAGNVVEGVVLHQVDLLDLEGLHEALSLGVVVWVAASTHRTLKAMLGKLGAIVIGGILRTTVGVMDAAWWRLARRNGGAQCGKRQTYIDPLADRIADNAFGAGGKARVPFLT